jgi:hypothetical protein
MAMAIGGRRVFSSAMLVMRASELIAEHALGVQSVENKFLIFKRRGPQQTTTIFFLGLCFWITETRS